MANLRLLLHLNVFKTEINECHSQFRRPELERQMSEETATQGICQLMVDSKLEDDLTQMLGKIEGS